MRLLGLTLAILVAACGNGTVTGDGGSPDLHTLGALDQGAASDGGGGNTDGGSGGMCVADPMTDGTACGAGCPNGTSAVNYMGKCTCFYACSPMAANCPCGRNCRGLCTPSDMGCVANGQGACLPANGPGERCGKDANMMPYGFGTCQDGTVCVNEDQGGQFAFCMYRCKGQADCPVGTSCLGLSGGSNACVINSQAMGIALGAACTPTDVCAVDSVCNGGKCVRQCDGPKDAKTCNGGKCTAVVDPSDGKTSAYICK